MAGEPKWGYGKLVGGLLTDMTQRMYPIDGNDVPLDSAPPIAASGRYGYDSGAKAATVLAALCKCHPHSMSVSDVDITTTGAKDIGTSPGDDYRVESITIKHVSGSVTTVPVISVGTNSPDYDNILAAATMTGISTVGKFQRFPMTGVQSAVTASTAIKAKVTVAAVGTAPLYRIDVTGTCE